MPKIFPNSSLSSVLSYCFQSRCSFKLLFQVLLFRINEWEDLTRGEFGRFLPEALAKFSNSPFCSQLRIYNQVAILPKSSPPRWRPKTLSCFIFESTTPLGGYYSESKSVNSCQLSKQLSACNTEEPSACLLFRAMSKDSARSYFFQPRCCSKLLLPDAMIGAT